MVAVYKYLDDIISEETAFSSGDYDKVFFQSDGSKKIVESYWGNALINVHYYRDPKENEEIALRSVSKYNCGFNVYTSEKYGQFLIENGNLYNQEQQLVAKVRELKNKNGEWVCFEELDISTGKPKYEETHKYIGKYDMSECDGGDTHYCRFHYNSDGSLFYCEFNYMSDYDSEDFHKNNIVEIRRKFVLSDAMYNYYVTADFLPPIE